ncbi:hypothetical protein LPN01_10105 [Sphingomonas sp. A2-49]|uniref:hypothetical protein n=1 Tax=Sphingomonas sp. A2-49 TaxID=1391375 RepID=UPI0021CE0DB3|nr:hypothetical protein [Sphingomonas sp. A2-49]MCU6454428.1 hypothetical protein [Sphingomonas sp. A2-49]
MVKVNSADWNGISADQQEQIRKIIGDNFAGQTVEPGETRGSELSAQANNACETACNVAEKVAIEACEALPWPASTVCKIAAKKAGDFCRSRC